LPARKQTEASGQKANRSERSHLCA
jgi:hypothetical protein